MSVDASTQAPQVPAGNAESWAANLKVLFDDTMKDLASTRSQYQQLALKTLTDAQAASQVHLLNVIENCKRITSNGVVADAAVGANVINEQADMSETTIDDLSAQMKSFTVQLNGILDALNAVVANMATGRPPVNQSGTTDAPVAK